MSGGDIVSLGRLLFVGQRDRLHAVGAPMDFIPSS
jgi:hypothetical protein